MAAPWIIELQTGPRDLDVEDGGMAKILTLSDDKDEGMFVRLQSWSDRKVHDELDRFIGKRLRVTVEIIE